MLDPAAGPYLFDTSAESWLARVRDPALDRWQREYLKRHSFNVSAITVAERARGYALLSQSVAVERRAAIEELRVAYLEQLGRVWHVDTAVSIVAGEIMAMLPQPPTPPRRTHQLAESRQERIVRWRFDCVIAATALVAQLALIHNNPADFESIRSAVECRPERFPRLGPLELVRVASLV